jgi:hypothetical protein
MSSSLDCIDGLRSVQTNCKGRNTGILRPAQNDGKNRQRQQQIPFGDDNQKCNGKGKGNRS